MHGLQSRRSPGPGPLMGPLDSCSAGGWGMVIDRQPRRGLQGTAAANRPWAGRQLGCEGQAGLRGAPGAGRGCSWEKQQVQDVAGEQAGAA